MTREVRAAVEALGIAIHDHLVISHKGHASFRSLGLFDLASNAPYFGAQQTCCAAPIHSHIWDRAYHAF